MASEINPNALCGLDEVKEYGNIRTAEDDRMLVELVNQQSARIERYCGRLFISREYVHDGTTMPRLTTRGGTLFRLPNPPVTAISGLKAYPDGTELTVASDGTGHAMLDQQSGMLHFGPGVLYGSSAWPAYEVLEVTYTGGYKKVGSLADSSKLSWLWGYDAVSSDIRWAAIKETVRQYEKRTLDREGILNRSEPGVSVTYLNDEWAPEVKAILDRYAPVPLPC
jgi:hypothetical protein